MNLGIGLGLTNYLRVPTVALDPDAAIAALFESGEEGAWYDPSDLTTVFQDAIGTTPAGVGDPVGLILDKSKGGVSATNQMPATSASDWTVYGANTISDEVDGSVLITCVNATDAALLLLSDFYPGIRNTTESRYITFEAKVTGGNGAAVLNGTSLGSTQQPISSTGYEVFTFVVKWGGFGLMSLQINMSVGRSINIKNIRIYEAPGNHATQTTSAARPILQQSGATPVLSGTELVTNGTFDTDTTGWTSLNSGSGTVVSQEVVVSAPNNYGGIQQPFSVIAGRRYSISVDMYADAGGSADIRVDSYFGLVTNSTSKVTKTTTFVAGYTGNMILKVYATTANINAYFDNISVQEVTSWSGGLRYLDFDGVDDYMQSAATGWADTTEGMVAAGANGPASTASIVNVGGVSSGSYQSQTDQIFLRANISGSSVFYSNDGTGSKTVSSTYSGTTTSIYFGYVDSGTNYLRIDGSETTGAGASGLMSVNQEIDIACIDNLGSILQNSNLHLFGLIIRTTAPTAGQVADVESYLAAKSGVTL